jgi:predicted metal-dependent hydrolase
MKLFAVSEGERRFVDTCATLMDALTLIHKFCEKRGFEEFCYKSREENNVIQLNIEGIAENFELELGVKSMPRYSQLFGSRLPYRGREYILGGVPGKKSFFDNAFCVPVDYSSDKVKAACIRIYRDLAKKDFTAKVKDYGLQMGIKPPNIRINSAKTKLCSCYGNNVLNFSWRLLMGTDDIIDYVIVYTLAHIIRTKNTPCFWKAIGEVLPDFKERQKHLKEWQNGLKDEIL